MCRALRQSVLTPSAEFSLRIFLNSRSPLHRSPATMMKAINQAGLTGITFPNRDTIFFKFQGSDTVSLLAFFV